MPALVRQLSMDSGKRVNHHARSVSCIALCKNARAPLLDTICARSRCGKRSRTRGDQCRQRMRAPARAKCPAMLLTMMNTSGACARCIDWSAAVEHIVCIRLHADMLMTCGMASPIVRIVLRSCVSVSPDPARTMYRRVFACGECRARCQHDCQKCHGSDILIMPGAIVAGVRLRLVVDAASMRTSAQFRPNICMRFVNVTIVCCADVDNEANEISPERIRLQNARRVCARRYDDAALISGPRYSHWC